ncbi:MAG: DegT/DnrJ/EryC1/StrS family aminotransferase [Oscillospiraceae bacterium]
MEKKNNFLPFYAPCETQMEEKYVLEVLRSKWWSTGLMTKKFENEFANLVGAKYVLAVNSCTAALHIALTALGVNDGDEVITVSMTFCSTVNTILHLRARPVFCDIDEKTGLMDLDLLESLITPKTKVILPVYYGGQCVNIEKVMEIAEKYKIKVLADAAHATGTYYNKKPIGNYADATAFSFYATKNLSTGEGGLLATNDEKVYEMALKLYLHGMDKDAYKRYDNSKSFEYDVTELGYKYNLSDINAAVGMAQLSHFSDMQESRRELSEIYRKELEQVRGIKPLEIEENSTSSNHLFVVKIENEYPLNRDVLYEKLREYNIGTSVHFIPVHYFTYYKKYFENIKLKLPKTEKFYSQILSLPLYSDMKKEDVYYVIDAIREIAQGDVKGRN